jgi:AcrR family transcriptional regulator
MPNVKPPRRRRPAETRRRIIDAAFDSFATRGYQATTMAEVARQAKVAEPTMYFSFGSKAALLREVMIARRGPDGVPTEVMAQSWVQEALTTRDQRRAFAISVENGTEIFRRLAPIADAMTAAGLTDPDVADVLEVIAGQRREGMARLIASIAAKGPLVVSERHATDVLDVVQSMATYNAFVRGCGWTTEQYKAWAYRTLIQVLPPATPARARSLDAAATEGLSFRPNLDPSDQDHNEPRRKKQ